jgi:plastocyanin
VVAAGPGGFLAGYATPVVVMVQGQGLLFVNGDVSTHNVVSLATTLKRVKVGSRYRWVKVRLFASRDVDKGGTGDVAGVQLLKPASYAFLCTIHPSMIGTLQVQAPPVPIQARLR